MAIVEQRHVIEELIGTPYYELHDLSLEASHRRYQRLVYKTSTGATASLVLMHDSKLQTYTTQSNKMPFVWWQQKLLRHGLCVPRIISIQAPLGWMAIEDLGPTSLSQQPTLPHYHKAIDQLVQLQSLTHQHPSAEACHPAFTADFFLNEMNFALEHLAHQHGKFPQQAQDIKALQNEMQHLCQQLAQQKFVLCHRDFHSRNLMCHNNKVYMIDFQDARLGPPQYDMVSLLYDAYAPLTPEQQKTLLAYYKQKVTSSPGLDSSLGFEQNWSLQILQRTFKACGSFASFYNLKGDTRYLKYLKPCFHILQQRAQTTNYKKLTQLFQQLKECL